MPAIEKAKEALEQYAYKPKSATDRPQTQREYRACEALAALEAEKPAEEAMIIAAQYAQTQFDMEALTQQIQQYAEAYHAKKQAEEHASPFVPRSFEEEAERYHLRKCKECKK